MGASETGKREVTIYTCDGCKASSTVGRGETPRGYSRVILPIGDVWLCTVCYGAVEWVARFQGVTVPPTVYGSGVAATLRKSTDQADKEQVMSERFDNILDEIANEAADSKAARPVAPKCEDHKPVQHRDARPPWCRACGLTADFREPYGRLETKPTERCPKCGVTATDQTPSAFYQAHDERCGGALSEPTERES